MAKSKIRLWRIMMENEAGEIVEFIYDIPDGLAKQIDELIEEHYQTTWKEEQHD